MDAPNAIYVNVSTAARAGGCTATCKKYFSGSKPPRDKHSDGIEYYNYQCVATPGSRWRFVRWEVTVRNTANRGDISYESYTLLTNPAPKSQNLSDWEQPMSYEVVGDDGEIYRTIKTEIISVAAVFEGIPGDYTPTHRLVNTSRRRVPVTLVHDPVTGLLVADY